MAFMHRLKEIRKELGYTQKEMAKECGIGCTTLQRYEKGAEFPAGALFIKIAELGYNLDWLLVGGSVKKIADSMSRPKQEKEDPSTNAVSLAERRKQKRRHTDDLPINEQLIPINEWLAQQPIEDRLDFLNDFRARFSDFEIWWLKKTGRWTEGKNIAVGEDSTM